MWCTAFNVSVEQSHTWRLASLFILFAYKIQECLFSAWNNFCSGFKWKYVFTKTRKSTGSSPLHWEAHSDSQQPSTQGLIRDSPGANCLVDSALAVWGGFPGIQLKSTGVCNKYAGFLIPDFSWGLMLTDRCWQGRWRLLWGFLALFGFRIRTFSWWQDLDLITWV